MAHEEYEEAFEQFYFGWMYPKPVGGIDPCPVGSVLLYQYCGNDQDRFEEMNRFLMEAFAAGVEHGKRISSQSTA